MPSGYPGSGKAKPRPGGAGAYHWKSPSQVDLRERIKELEARIKQMDRRDKSLGDLKKWMAARKLTPPDLMWMYKQMLPRRADKPVKSEKPLKPLKGRWADNPKHAGHKERRATGTFMEGGVVKQAKGDPEFRAAVKAARVEQEMSATDLGKKIGASAASITSWEAGRYIPNEQLRAKIVKVLGLPATLGQEASLAMEAERGRAGGRASQAKAHNGAQA